MDINKFMDYEKYKEALERAKYYIEGIPDCKVELFESYEEIDNDILQECIENIIE